jgi:hypothetical protein
VRASIVGASVLLFLAEANVFAQTTAGRAGFVRSCPGRPAVLAHPLATMASPLLHADAGLSVNAEQSAEVQNSHDSHNRSQGA